MLLPLANWQNPTLRRVRVLQAVQERDLEALLEFHTAYMALKGKKRNQLSPRTLTIYQAGIRDFVEWVWPSGSPAPLFQLHQATEDQIDAWIGELLAEGSNNSKPGKRKALKPQSAEALLKGVRSLFAAFRWAGLAEELSVRVPKDPTPAEDLL